ncbi:amidinotransferase [Pseudomonas sp. COR58]|uniref:Amidinotransferase n=1 Tax=Pseudomonas ekonensis TaxID=2842353 RepID=A0ABS6PD11_9PSED|nr:arginine deiminase-related protein [Pseudomonas ekonensis]MBV4458360.1 amidinotransferase [Pseudomonas ekonensis]
MQTTNTVLMIRPTRFSFNQDTAANNRFQRPAEHAEDVQLKALQEFDGYVAALRGHGVEVLVHNDREAPHTPDSIFPNNWWSSHPDGTLVLYPMQGQNRRLERDKGVLDWLGEAYRVERLVDLSGLERQEVFLEGTGSMVLDRQQRICYAGYSTRTHGHALAQAVEQLGYSLCAFNAVDRQGVAIYHTNVMMSVGTRLAVACLDSVADAGERRALRSRLEESGKQVVALDWAQLEAFAGNMLEVRTATGEPLLVMSRTAWQSLDSAQRRTLESLATPLAVNIDTIERIGGGSARCMLAEVFFPKREPQPPVAKEHTR